MKGTGYGVGARMCAIALAVCTVCITGSRGEESGRGSLYIDEQVALEDVLALLVFLRRLVCFVLRRSPM